MTATELQKLFLPALAPEDFFILLACATQKEKVFLLAHPKYNLGKPEETHAREFFERRLKHEPVALIVGHKEFYGYNFKVTKDTLIPRPETELLVELMLNEVESQKLKVKSQITIIDVGTGSGNIIIAIAKEVKRMYQVLGIRYYAADISKKALAIAKENAKIHNIDHAIVFLHGNLLKSLSKEVFSADAVLLVANLPYLSEEIYRATDDDVKEFEPRGALISGRAGLDHYYRLLNQIKDLQRPITLFLEISPEQTLSLKKRVSTLFPNARTMIHQDLAGKDRVLEAKIH